MPGDACIKLLNLEFFRKFILNAWERILRYEKIWKYWSLAETGTSYEQQYLDNLVQNILGKVKLGEIGQDKQTLILFLIFVSKLFLIFCYFDICVILDH